MLERDEYIEQAYLFRSLLERMDENASVQDLLRSIREEILSTTNLPKAIDFLTAELKLTGALSDGMSRSATTSRRFRPTSWAKRSAKEASSISAPRWKCSGSKPAFRGEGSDAAGLVRLSVRIVARNRLGYDRGLEAMSRDPIYDDAWREWILNVRRQVGIVDFADLLYVRSEHFSKQRKAQGLDGEGREQADPVRRERRRIALAHRRKDPLLAVRRAATTSQLSDRGATATGRRTKARAAAAWCAASNGSKRG